MFSPRKLRDIAPFDYMRYAKQMEYTPGHFLAGSAMPVPTNELVGFEADDFTITSMCHNYGDPRALEALRARFDVAPKNIVLTSGSSEGNAATCLALLEPGDQVLAETPGYGAFRLVPPLYHAEVVGLPRREENGFLPDVEEFKKLLSPKTRLVILSNLHNPTLAYMEPELLKQLIALAAENNAYVLVDEVYLDHLKLGTHDATCFHYGENVIATSSLTKVYGLGPLRFGWAFGPEEVVGRILELEDLVLPEHPAIAHNLGLRALKNLDRLRKHTRDRYEEGFPVMQEWAASRDDVTHFEALGGVTAAIKIDGVHDTWNFADQLSKKHGVSVAPGAAFEMEGWVRVNIMKPAPELRTALAALGRGIDALKAVGV